MTPTPQVLDTADIEMPSTTRGPLRTFRHAPPAGRMQELITHKRWYYVTAATEQHLIGASIVSLGYLNKAFFYVADKHGQRMLARASAIMPAGPWAKVARAEHGASTSTFRSPTLSVKIVRAPNGGMGVRAKSSHASFEMMLDAVGDPIVAANFLPNGGTNITEKGLALVGRGRVHVGKDTFEMTRALGGSDFTDGYLPRHTQWKWANVSGRAGGHTIGLNLVQGFMGACECVLRIDDDLITLGEGRITMGAEPMAPWQVTSACGRVDLTFTPFALHQENTDLGLIHAKFSQPIGVFSGTVKNGRTIAVRDLLGVCEDQDVLW